MKKSTKVIFTMSVLMNVAVAGVAGIYLYKSTSNAAYSSYYLEKISMFEQLPSDKKDIIFLGDSLIDNNEWSEMLSNTNVKNRGIRGDTTTGVLNRLDGITAGHPSSLFLFIGANDLEAGLSTKEVVRNYRLIIQKINENSPSTQIIIQGLLPVDEMKYDGKLKNQQIIALNTELQIVARENKLPYIDLYNVFYTATNDQRHNTYDGIHLNGEAYKKWAKTIESYIPPH